MRHSNKRQKIYKKRPEDQRDCYLVLFEFGSLSEGSMWAGLPAVCSGMAESGRVHTRLLNFRQCNWIT